MSDNARRSTEQDDVDACCAVIRHLRSLVKEAYWEGFEDGSGEDRSEYHHGWWDDSDVKGELDK